MGSSPVVGSSKSRISGCSAIARAKPTRRRMPPESSDGRFSSMPGSRTSSRHSATRSAISCFDFFVCRMSGNAMFSPTLIESKSAPSWNDIPNFRRRHVALAARHRPEVLAVDLDRAGVGLQEADDVLEEDALADARLAEEDERLALLDGRGRGRSSTTFGPNAFVTPRRADRGDAGRRPRAAHQ